MSQEPRTTFEHKRSASPLVSTQGWVRGVYAHAIEYTTADKSVRGAYFLFGGLLGGGGGFFMAWVVLSPLLIFTNPQWFWYALLLVLPAITVFTLLGIGMLIWYARREFFRPLDLPILFDRKHRQVIWMDRWPPGGLRGMFKPWPVRISRCDWDRIVPEHHVVTYTTGSTARQQHTLALMVPHASAQAAAESSTPFADGLLLGEPMTLTEQTVPAVWEHVRRYMNEKGPALPPGEAVCDSARPMGWWQSFGAVSMFGPGYVKRWRETPYMMGFMHLIAPLMLPLGLAMATANWLSYLTAYDVPWPQDVLDQVGPLLPIQAADALSTQVERIQRQSQGRGRV